MANGNKVIRKLRAILSADVKGYSLLMADDEIHTIHTLKSYRQIMSDLIQQHSGRVVDNPGDNLLAEFGSAVDAVECAVEIQNRLKKENARFVEDKRLRFRIGVNIGDVVQDGDRIYGSGVNIAARIEGIADPGGVCISRNAYNQIKDKLSLGYKYLGQHKVKNIKDPASVYKVLMDTEDAGKLIGEKKKRSKLKWALITVAISIVVAAGVIGGLYWKYFYLPAPSNIDPENKMTFDLSKGPTVAVLPFDNMTGDLDQDYFCDGITENIISTLSYVPELFVIARNSSFAYRGKQINIQQIGKELNANWVIEGSIQKSKERIRITVQLIDATSGHHKWSEIYDREIDDLFKLQDEIAFKILKEMQIKLVMGESIRNVWSGVKTIQEYEKGLKAYYNWVSFTAEKNKLAQKESHELIDMNPDIPLAYTLLALTYIEDIWYDQCEILPYCFGKANEAVRKALLLNENFDMALLASGYIFLIKGEHDKAISAVKKALTINPNSAEAYSVLGLILIYADQLDEAIAYIKKAFRLNPLPPSSYYMYLGFAYQNMRRFHEAVEAYNKSLELNPEDWSAIIGLVIVYGHMGDTDNAKRALLELFRVRPNFSKSHLLKTVPLKNKETLKFIGEGLRKAGLSD
jgi:adenylate cyclase